MIENQKLQIIGNSILLHKDDGTVHILHRHGDYLTLNGYVAYPKGHKMFGKHYDDVPCLSQEPTFSEKANIFALPDHWAIGFDHNHFDDYSPREMFTGSHKNNPTIEDLFSEIEQFRKDIESVI